MAEDGLRWPRHTSNSGFHVTMIARPVPGREIISASKRPSQRTSRLEGHSTSKEWMQREEDAGSTMPTWIIDRAHELMQWLMTLDRPFAFLLALPFVVALAGLAAEIVRQRGGRLPNRSNGEAG